MKTDGNLFTQILKDSQKNGTAAAAINMLNYNTARAIIKAAERAMQPVILQPSVGTVKRYGVEATARMVNGLRADSYVPVALHLDHCKEEEFARACIRAGWDSVMMDFSALPFEDNVLLTRRMADYAHMNGVTIEGEIGVIAGVEDDIAHEASALASYGETVEYIQRTGIDAVAPAIGTAHGVYKGKPKLNFELVERLGTNYVPVVVHGGTGLSEEDFRKLIVRGAAKINISTALKQTYLAATRKAAADEAIAPVEFDRIVEDECSKQMELFIRLFAGEEIRVYDSQLFS